jgi:hypothetical protein
MLPKLISQSKRLGKNTIFISYRRSDAQGYAGRLEDSLRGYFGEDRVFRDIGGIAPGEDFKHKIEESIEAAGALIVLIGPNWLVQSEKGLPRLHDPGDQVADEIEAALRKGRVVVPVLVEGALMPREEDLPNTLKELARRNAVTISDENWLFDVNRLAKVLSMDISGSIAERKLGLLKLIILTLLFVGMAFNILLFTRAALSTTCIVSQNIPELYPKEKESDPGSFIKSLSPFCESSGANAARPFTKFEAIVNPMCIFVVILLLIGTRTFVEQSRRKFIWAAVCLGSLGGVLLMIYYLLTVGFNPVAARTVAFATTSIINVGMLTLAGLSGFKPNDRVS